MAAINSTQSGTWSDPATWASGIVPGPDDTVTIGNNNVVTIDSNVSVTTITNSGSGRIVLTGSTAYTITASSDLTWNVSGNPNPGMFTFDSNYSAEGTVIQAQSVIIGSHRNATPIGYFVTEAGSTGSATINLNSIDRDTNTTGGTKLNLSLRSMMNVTINCSSEAPTHPNANHLYFVSGGGTLTYNGDFGSGNGTIIRLSSGTATFTGDIQMEVGPLTANVAAGSGSIYFTGNITQHSPTGPLLDWMGNINVVLGQPGEVRTIKIAPGTDLGEMPIYNRLFYNNSTAKTMIADDAALALEFGTNPTYYIKGHSPDADLLPEDVVEGVVYDEDDKVGTLDIPSPADVALGTPVGSTVGTAVLKASDVAMITGSQITALAAQDPPEES